MTPLAVMLLVGFSPLDLRDPTVVDEVDIIEINHCWQLCGDELHRRYSQAIFWRDLKAIGERGPEWRMRCAHYVMLGDNVRVGVNVVRWRDGPTRYVVRAPVMHTTHTLVEDDPEIVDREHIEGKWRRGIIGMDGKR